MLYRVVFGGTVCHTPAGLCGPGPFGKLAAAWFVSKQRFVGDTSLGGWFDARLVGLLSAAVGTVCL